MLTNNPHKNKTTKTNASTNQPIDIFLQVVKQYQVGVSVINNTPHL